MKQYYPRQYYQLIKRCYKLWYLACMSSYLYNSDVYQGKVQAFKDDLGFGLGGRIVRQMTEGLSEKSILSCLVTFFRLSPILNNFGKIVFWRLALFAQIRNGVLSLHPTKL
ncbi:hypothetical protein QYM36_008855 [Artemia franciscana]|uniref:Uncharacterized protein n=1 Tax=Artemia franciscana TaxID=6661 RepID=A0AA88HSN0_ARTSF|nr:hypothetical protein QYM36_008855 [Artemia franciscana]